MENGADRERARHEAGANAEGPCRGVTAKGGREQADLEGARHAEVLPDGIAANGVWVSDPQGDESYAEARCREGLAGSHPRDWLDPSLADVPRREEQQVDRQACARGIFGIGHGDETTSASHSASLRSAASWV